MKYFVTFEGIDGSGKSTVSRGVYDWLKKEGLDVVLTFEPTNGFIGETVRRCVEENCDPVVTAFLFIADRVEHCKEIREWLNEGKIVLCDRYADSTYAYQGVQLENVVDEPMEWLQGVSKNFIIKPEKTFLFDINPEVALRRIQGRERLISFERKEFLAKVRENYLRLAEEQGFVVLNAEKKVDELIQECVRSILGD